MKKTQFLSFLFKTALVLSLVICPLLGTAQTRIAIFGGSVAQFFNDRGAQDVLAAMLPGAEFHNFGKAGDGNKQKSRTAKP